MNLNDYMIQFDGKFPAMENNDRIGFNEPPVYYNVDHWIQLYDWSTTVDNILFITGLSGGGKGYIAKQMAKQHSNSGEVVIIELDKFENYPWYHGQKEGNNFVAKGDEIIFNFLNKRYDNDLETDHWLTNMEKYKQDLRDFMFYIIDHAKKNPKTRFIVEGIQIFFDDFFADEILLDREHNRCKYPMIIIQTSQVKSMTKVMHRPHNQIRNRLHSKEAGPSALKAFMRKLNLDRQEYYVWS